MSQRANRYKVPGELQLTAFQCCHCWRWVQIRIVTRLNLPMRPERVMNVAVVNQLRQRLAARLVAQLDWRTCSQTSRLR